MRSGLAQRVSLALTLGVCAVALLPAQQGGGRGGTPAPAQTPAVRQIPRSPVVDQAAHDRGRALWASHCIDCHGSQARGSETGPNIIRTKTVNFDRTAEQAGSVLGPFLKAGHPTQSKKPSASFTDEEVVALANFLRQRVNDTMRGSPVFTVGDIVIGDPKAGEAYFNGEGGCASCHNSTTGSLAGVATRIPEPVDLQQRMLFPGGGGGRGRGRGAPPAGAAPDRNAVTVTITPASGPAISGVLVEESDFYVTVRDADGTIRTVRRTPGMKVAKTNPLQAHIDLLDRISDKQIHDLVAYLETLK
ncbi:MAG TPA: c-type cytochrome [Vicinamibacterales bacterium]|nr:c-type cytochrome [Vicinamibacterales bacterium]